MTVSRVSDYLDFGRYLQLERERKGLSLDDISQQTKIPRTLLGALEAGQAERFPERIFVLNYLRSYASVVGLQPDVVVERFHEIPDVPLPAVFNPAELEQARRERAVTTLWATVATALFLSLALAMNAMFELALRYTHR